MSDDVYDAIPDVPDNAPSHDPHWCEIIVDEWYGIWSDIEWSTHIRAELHIPTLRRLYTYKSRWHDVNDRLHDAEILLKGSRGQLVKNPLFAELRELEDTILRMEKEFGMTLRSASLINLKLGEGELNWAELREKRRREGLAAGKKAAALNQKT